MKVGLLDLCHIAPGRTPAETLAGMTALAVRADRLGYSRFWLAEHHSSTIAHASPELLLPVLARATRRIRVGTAGVLLMYRSALRVADEFRLLATLFPGRVDLGVGRGLVPGLTAEALLDGRPLDLTPERYRVLVEDLIAFLHETRPPDHHYRGAWVTPQSAGGTLPELWLLGAGRTSMALAAELGTAFGYALFLEGDGDDPAVLDAYRQRFRPCPWRDRPRDVLAVAGVCARTEARARALLAERGSDGIVPSVVGTPRQCRARLVELAERYRTDEVIYLELAPQAADRLRAIELLAEACGLTPAGRRGASARG
jgi:luciferase family oxidoreductase group 1